MSQALSVLNNVRGGVNLFTGLAQGGILSQFASPLLNGINIPGFGPILIKRSRSIDKIIPNVVVEEMHRDRLSITSHPVEIGAAITDHAFKEPRELVMRCGWSNSTGGYESFIQNTYTTLLNLQLERRPFAVSTGKRQYNNMLIADITVTTDAASEYILMATVQLQEVILVRLTTIRQDPGQQADPSKTQAPGKTGTKIPDTTGKSISETVGNPNAPPPVSSADFAPPGGGTGPKEAFGPPQAPLSPTQPGGLDDFGRPIPTIWNNTDVQTPTPTQPMASPPTPTNLNTNPNGIPVPTTSGPSFPPPANLNPNPGGIPVP